MSSIIGKKISKRVFFKFLLRDIDIYIHSGEITGLLGPSGSGKSTLLKVLSLIDTEFSGDLIHSGFDRRTDISRSMGYVNQSDILNPGLSVIDTLYYSYRIRNHVKQGNEQVIKEIKDLIKSFNLETRMHARLKNLSGGERKRVHIINELLSAPSFLFLDEPLSGLDPANADRIIRFLQKYAKNGNTVVMTTHSMDSMDYLHKVYYLSRGRLIFYGKTEEIAQHFSSNSISESYKKVIRQNPEFLVKLFQKSSGYKQLNSLIDGFEPYKLQQNPMKVIQGCDKEIHKGNSIDEEFRNIIDRIRDKKENE